MPPSSIRYPKPWPAPEAWRPPARWEGRLEWRDNAIFELAIRPWTPNSLKVLAGSAVCMFPLSAWLTTKAPPFTAMGFILTALAGLISASMIADYQRNHGKSGKFIHDLGDERIVELAFTALTARDWALGLHAARCARGLLAVEGMFWAFGAAGVLAGDAWRNGRPGVYAAIALFLASWRGVVLSRYPEAHLPELIRNVRLRAGRGGGRLHPARRLLGILRRLARFGLIAALMGAALIGAGWALLGIIRTIQPGTNLYQALPFDAAALARAWWPPLLAAPLGAAGGWARGTYCLRNASRLKAELRTEAERMIRRARGE